MAAAPGAVFVSYRRKDTGHAAYRIREGLAATLGDESVFAENDVLRILAHQAGETVSKPPTRAIWPANKANARWR
jgi:hypothetical protein